MYIARDREQSKYQMGCIQADMKKILYKEIRFSKETFKEFGFQVFSQWNEDGIIQYLINAISIPEYARTFVEFGVENYEESNTKFLLLHDDWSGIIIDSNEKNIAYAKSCSYYWKHDITAITAFIDKDNINDLINSIPHKEIGLLSIDIDGNDYYIWDALNSIKPYIVICEINPMWGKTMKVTTPYKKNFNRTKEHFSNLYFGASISAMCSLGESKGYSLVAINSAGTNLFFVRNDSIGDFEIYSPSELWKKPKYRESRNYAGELTFLRYEEAIELIKEMELVNLENNRMIKINDI